MNHFLVDDFSDSLEIICENPQDYKSKISGIIGLEFSKNIDQQHRLRIRLPWIEMGNYYKTDKIFTIPEVTQKLLSSDLMLRDWIILFYGYNVPVLKVKTKVFCENCYSFMTGSGHQGFYGFSEDGKLLIEFTDDENESIYTNFKL